MRTAPSSPAAAAESTPSLARAFRERPVSTFLSTGFGVGLFPWAPGTAGSAAALALACGENRLLRFFFFQPSHGPSMAAAVGLLASGLAIGAIGVPLTTRTSRAIGVKDPGVIVLDEFAGQLVASSAVPLFAYASMAREAFVWLVSFLASRLFDIWKPGPIRRLQALPGGVGIVIDDILAGALAAGATGLAGVALGA
ncbi:MAG: phosphatidylglycerophosphatase A [Acidobacteriota bacterium]|nr:phosphatidylglycerophosphatase A [Acidobacteriota bacterium]